MYPLLMEVLSLKSWTPAIFEVKETSLHSKDSAAYRRVLGLNFAFPTTQLKSKRAESVIINLTKCNHTQLIVSLEVGYKD
jgi:hypothetical protein